MDKSGRRVPSCSTGWITCLCFITSRSFRRIFWNAAILCSRLSEEIEQCLFSEFSLSNDREPPPHPTPKLSSPGLIYYHCWNITPYPQKTNQDNLYANIWTQEVVKLKLHRVVPSITGSSEVRCPSGAVWGRGSISSQVSATCSLRASWNIVLIWIHCLRVVTF